MRMVRLSVEKHLLPSCKCEISKHNVEILFSIHEEATEAIIDFYKTPRRDLIKRKSLIEKMKYCIGRIKSDLNSESGEVGSKPLYKFIRVYALDRLLKVEKEMQMLTEANPL